MIAITDFSKIPKLPSTVDISHLLDGFHVSGTRLKSNTISHSESTRSYIKFTNKTAGVVKVSYSVSSESSYDCGLGVVNTTTTDPGTSPSSGVLFKSSGILTTAANMTVQPGTWYLHLKYFKDSSVSKNEDCLYIDGIELPVDEENSFAKINGSWVPIKEKRAKVNGTWVLVKDTYAKVNGAWVLSA